MYAVQRCCKIRIRHFLLLLHIFLLLEIFPIHPVSPQAVPSNMENNWSGTVSVFGETGCTSFRLDARIVPENFIYIRRDNIWRLVIPVSTFKARLWLIERDFFEMIRGKDYPEIIVLIPSLKEEVVPFPVEINMAGKTIQTLVIPVNVHEAQKNVLIFQGITSINWRKLGLVPPHRFGDICELHDTIMIKFALKRNF